MAEVSIVKLPSDTGPNLGEVSIGSGNGLVPSGNKPLPEPMLIEIYVAIWCYRAVLTHWCWLDTLPLKTMTSPKCTRHNALAASYWCVMGLLWWKINAPWDISNRLLSWAEQESFMFNSFEIGWIYSGKNVLNRILHSDAFLCIKDCVTYF